MLSNFVCLAALLFHYFQTLSASEGETNPDTLIKNLTLKSKVDSRTKIKFLRKFREILLSTRECLSAESCLGSAIDLMRMT